MEKRIIYLAFAFISLLLCSCEPDDNWFYHPVRFNGEVSDPKMVMTSTLHGDMEPMVYLNSSYFFLSPNSVDTVEIYYTNGQGDRIVQKVKYPHRGFIENANVEIQINGEGWQKMLAVDTVRSDRYSYSEKFEIQDYYYTLHRRLQAGDKVELRASHPDYKETAYATQTIPMYPNVRIEKVDTFPKLKMTGCDLVLPYIPENENLVVCVYGTAYMRGERVWHEYDYIWNPLTKTYTKIDKGLRNSSYHNQFCYIYSSYLDCARYDVMNTSVSQGYYGAEGMGLHFSTASAGAELRVPILVFNDAPIHREYSDDERLDENLVDSVVLDVEILSEGAYLYRSSLVAGRYLSADWVMDAFGSEYDMSTDIVGDIEDMFNEMGIMEQTQVYSNVDGALGHVGAIVSEHFVIRRGDVLLNP